MTRRRRTLDALGSVCDQIAKLLAGQDLDLASLPLPGEGEPGETKLERLQRFKAHLQETLGKLDRGEPLVCRRCARPLADAALDEMPWATSCGCEP